MDTAIMSLIYLTGTIFVSFFAARFFNSKPYGPKDTDVINALSKNPNLEPALPKFVTEKTRYNLFLTAFVGFTIILYYFVSLIFPIFVLNWLEVDLATNSSIALVVGTLAFINLSSKLPFVRRTLTDWKSYFHKRAKIPDQAMYVFDSLRFSGINKLSPHYIMFTKKNLKESILGKERTDIDSSYFLFEKDRIERKWSRLVYLMHTVEKWSSIQSFERHLKTESLKWLALRAYYYDNLIPKMEQYQKGILSENDTEFTKKEIDIFLIKIYWLITLLLFMTNKAGEDPCIHLKQIGWIVTPEKYFEFSVNQIAVTGLTIFISILAGATISSVILIYLGESSLKDFLITPSLVLYWLIYGIPLFVTPLIVTMLFKRYLSMNGVWSIQRPEDPKISFSTRQWDIYFLVSFFSYIATFALLSVILLFISSLDREVRPDALANIAAYSALAFVTSGFICYLIDTPIPGWETNLQYYMNSLPSALLQGALNVAIILFVFLLLSNNSFDIFTLLPEERGRLTVYSVIGFIIGMVIHLTTRIRTKHYERRSNEADRETYGWWTICVASIKKRIEVTSRSNNHLVIPVDNELKEVANIGDPIEFYSGNKLVMTGSIEKVHDESIIISIPI